jgi:Cu2+-exporting ATPase
MPASNVDRASAAPSHTDARAAAAGDCRHCGQPIPAGAEGAFCCRGCAMVFELLHRERLERYYDLRGRDGEPVADRAGRRDDKWLEPLMARVAGCAGDELCRVDLDVQGLHCAACVWLFQTTFAREHGVSIQVDPGVGKAKLVVRNGFDLRGWIEGVERFGYRFGPSLKQEAPANTALLVRMGICVAITMNAMILAISVYAGLPPGKLRSLFDLLSFGFATLAVLVGGSLFFQSAWQGLRRRVLHLDIPIALGIALAYGASAAAYFAGRADATYFDTLDTFITLMLVGRWLQERVLAENRKWLLASDGVDGLLTRRIGDDGAAALIRCTEIEVGDRLLIAPGDLLPVEATLEDVAAASFSLDWINGESAPRAFDAAATVPAGAFSATDRPLRVLAKQPFAQSTLVDLLRAPVARDADDHRPTSPFWTAFARYYVVGVLVVASLGFLVGWLRTHDALAAIDVVAAVLIVTCPCAFGIAVPLAYEMVQARLRRDGLFVRAPGFLDRAARVRRVVFDKTGTLTTGVLALADLAPLERLSADERAVLMALASVSTHPKSVAVARALAGVSPATDVEVIEVPGKGMEARRGAHVYRFGSPRFALVELARPSGLGGLGGIDDIDDIDGAHAIGGVDERADVLFALDGASLAAITTREELRHDARVEVPLLRQAGYGVEVLSGDTQARVEEVAASCGIDAKAAHGARTASQKAAWMRSVDRRDTLMVGDGINDALVVAESWCSGTPAIDRPFMAARADFYFITEGLRPIRAALEASRWLDRTVRSVLVTALAYNVLTVVAAYLGLMSPLACAIAMPLSSITTILRVTLPLRARARRADAATRTRAPLLASPELTEWTS